METASTRKSLEEFYYKEVQRDSNTWKMWGKRSFLFFNA